MKPATFCVESPLANVLIGSFVLVVSGIPEAIVLVGYLTGSACGVAPEDQPACLAVVSVFLVLGLAAVTRRDLATVDPTARSIRWHTSMLGLTWSSVVWSGADLGSLDIRRAPRNRFSAYWLATWVRGPKGERVLFADDFLQSATADARAAIEGLRLKVEHTDTRRA